MLLKTYRCDPAYINSTDVKGKVIFCITPSKMSPPPKLSDIISILLKNGGKGLIFSQYNMDGLDQWQYTSTRIPFIAVDLEIANQMLQYLKYVEINSNSEEKYCNLILESIYIWPKIMLRHSTNRILSFICWY